MSTGAPVLSEYPRNRPSPASLDSPYAEPSNRPDRLAWAELDSMTGHLFPWRSKASNSVEANPKFPSMNSDWSFGRFTPARLKTKSAREQ